VGPSDRGEALCPLAKKPISDNGESDQTLASIGNENFSLVELARHYRMSVG
jgi:hypothetical protein